MSKSTVAMSSWLGSLARGGVLTRDEVSEAGVGVAAYVVGPEALEELRAWMGEQSEEAVRRERRAAVEVCIWMANADRQLDPEESHLLSQIISRSGLDEATMDELVTEVHDPPSLADIEERLTHPVLRELMLALAWEMAEADGEVARSEAAFYTGLAKRLGVEEARAAELRQSVTARVSKPPSA
jgi:uncharacterized tellurite resistance protein B-like protein